MANNVTFELKSKCSIETVYGVSTKTLERIKTESDNAEGYDWCVALENTADQREEFLSGNDIEDAELLVTENGSAKVVHGSGVIISLRAA